MTRVLAVAALLLLPPPTTAPTTASSARPASGAGAPRPTAAPRRRRRRGSFVPAAFVPPSPSSGPGPDRRLRRRCRTILPPTETSAAVEKQAGGSERRTTKKGRASADAKKRGDDPTFWIDARDPFVVVAADGEVFATGGSVGTSDDAVDVEGSNDVEGGDRTKKKRIEFTIRGNPRPLVRHRTARGFVYNPSRAAQEAFRDCLLNLLPPEHRPTVTDDDEHPDEGGRTTYLFAPDEFLRMSVTFRTKRPLAHFVGNKPGPGRLKPSAPGKLHPGRSDVDNLAKFVMDSLNGVVYDDDRQVVRLEATRVLDSEGRCRGGTDVTIEAVGEDDL